MVVKETELNAFSSLRAFSAKQSQTKFGMRLLHSYLVRNDDR